MNQNANTEPTFVELMGDALEEQAATAGQAPKDTPTILEQRLVELDRMVTSLSMIELRSLALPHNFYNEVREVDAVMKKAIEMLNAMRLKAVVKMHTKDKMSIEDIALAACMTPESVKGLLIYHQNYVMPKGISSQVLSMDIRNTDLHIRAQNCLDAANIKTLGDLVERTEEEVLKCPNFGQKSLNDVKEMLASYGLALKPKDGETKNA